MAFFKTDQQLAAERAKRNKRMPALWYTDQMVARDLRLSKIEDNYSVRVVWPTGMAVSGKTAISAHDNALLSVLMKRSDTRYLIIPHNTGGHWQPKVFFKQDDAWHYTMLTTKMDGTCGRSLVEEATNFVKQGPVVYAKTHAINIVPAQSVLKSVPTISALEQSQIKKAAADSLVSINKPTPSERQLQTAIANSVETAVMEASADKQAEQAQTEIAIKRSVDASISSFDLELAYLADAELAGNAANVHKSQETLVELLGKMPNSEKEKAIARLADSNLLGKASIETVVAKVFADAVKQPCVETPEANSETTISPMRCAR